MLPSPTYLSISWNLPSILATPPIKTNLKENPKTKQRKKQKKKEEKEEKGEEKEGEEEDPIMEARVQPAETHSLPFSLLMWVNV